MFRSNAATPRMGCQGHQVVFYMAVTDMNPSVSGVAMYRPVIDLHAVLHPAKVVVLIQQLVSSINLTTEPAFHVTLDESGDERVSPTSLSKHFKYIGQLHHTCPEHYEHNNILEMFWWACEEVGLEWTPLGIFSMNSTETGYLSTAQTMNALVDKIRQRDN
jgi:hypothetical protein